jgi:hypothetical protein
LDGKPSGQSVEVVEQDPDAQHPSLDLLNGLPLGCLFFYIAIAPLFELTNIFLLLLGVKLQRDKDGD